MSDDEQPPPHQHAPFGGAIGGGPECLVCPVCVLLQALTTARPEVTEHLLAAAKELTLALQAALDAQAKAYDDARDRLERIDVE
jgi:hypothetical protein